MTTGNTKSRDFEDPFLWPMGESVYRLAPRVQEHVMQTPGTTVTYRGRMRVWREGGWRGVVAGWLLRVGTLARTMFPEIGEDVEFEMQHAVERHADGSFSMTWHRTFYFGDVTRRFDAVMRFLPSRSVIDWIGSGGLLHVELLPREKNYAIVVLSGREWVCLGRLRIPIPPIFRGRPQVREWEESDGALRIKVEIHNTILGQFFGYEGSYSRTLTVDC